MRQEEIYKSRIVTRRTDGLQQCVIRFWLQYLPGKKRGKRSLKEQSLSKATQRFGPQPSAWQSLIKDSI